MHNMTLDMRIILLPLIFCSLILTNQSKADTNYTIISNWGFETKEWKTLATFEDLLRKNLPGESFLVFGPNTVPAEHQLKITSLGIFDFLFTRTNSIPDLEKAAFLLESWPLSSAKLRKERFWKALEMHYKKIGLKLLSVINSGNGYHLLLREKPNSCNLQGAKISVIPPFDRFIENLAGLPVKRTTAIEEKDLMNPEIDGFFSPIENHALLRWSKNTRFRTQPIGSVNHLIFMNLSKWNSLKASERLKIDAASVALENEIYADRKRKAGVFFSDMQKKNIRSIDFCNNQRHFFEYEFIKAILSLSPIRPSLLPDQFKELIEISTDNKKHYDF